VSADEMPDTIVVKPSMATKTRSLMTLFAVASVFGIGLGLPPPRPPREITDEDLARIERARAKRARRAAARGAR
jgi:hypothetical protein